MYIIIIIVIDFSTHVLETLTVHIDQNNMFYYSWYFV